MYDLLAPGGMLAIGNAIALNEHFWTPDLMGDWTMLYRTEDKMLRLTTKLPEEARVEIVNEPAEAYYFLLVRKP